MAAQDAVPPARRPARRERGVRRHRRHSSGARADHAAAPAGLPLVWIDPWPRVAPGGHAYATVDPHPGAERDWAEAIVTRAEEQRIADAAAAGELALAGLAAADALRDRRVAPALGERGRRPRPAARAGLAAHRGAPREGLLPRPGDRREGAQPRPPAASASSPCSSTGATRVLPVARRRRCSRARTPSGVVTSAALHFEEGPIALAVVRRSTPVDADARASDTADGADRRRAGGHRAARGGSHREHPPPAAARSPSRLRARRGRRPPQPTTTADRHRMAAPHRSAPRTVAACSDSSIAILQIVVATTGAYAFAHYVLGHPAPLLAATVCVSSLGLVRDAPPAARARDGARACWSASSSPSCCCSWPAPGGGSSRWRSALTLVVARFLSAQASFAIAAGDPGADRHGDPGQRARSCASSTASSAAIAALLVTALIPRTLQRDEAARRARRCPRRWIRRWARSRRRCGAAIACAPSAGSRRPARCSRSWTRGDVARLRPRDRAHLAVPAPAALRAAAPRAHPPVHRSRHAQPAGHRAAGSSTSATTALARPVAADLLARARRAAQLVAQSLDRHLARTGRARGAAGRRRAPRPGAAAARCVAGRPEPHRGAAAARRRPADGDRHDERRGARPACRGSDDATRQRGRDGAPRHGQLAQPPARALLHRPAGGAQRGERGLPALHAAERRQRRGALPLGVQRGQEGVHALARHVAVDERLRQPLRGDRRMLEPGQAQRDASACAAPHPARSRPRCRCVRARRRCPPRARRPGARRAAMRLHAPATSASSYWRSTFIARMTAGGRRRARHLEAAEREGDAGCAANARRPGPHLAPAERGPARPGRIDLEPERPRRPVAPAPAARAARAR